MLELELENLVVTNNIKLNNFGIADAKFLCEGPRKPSFSYPVIKRSYSKMPIVRVSIKASVRSGVRPKASKRISGMGLFHT